VSITKRGRGLKERIIEDQEACISAVLNATQVSKVGPVPNEYHMDSWCAGYEAALQVVQDIINEYIAKGDKP